MKKTGFFFVFVLPPVQDERRINSSCMIENKFDVFVEFLCLLYVAHRYGTPAKLSNFIMRETWDELERYTGITSAYILGKIVVFLSSLCTGFHKAIATMVQGKIFS